MPGLVLEFEDNIEVREAGDRLQPRGRYQCRTIWPSIKTNTLSTSSSRHIQARDSHLHIVISLCSSHSVSAVIKFPQPQVTNMMLMRNILALLPFVAVVLAAPLAGPAGRRFD